VSAEFKRRWRIYVHGNCGVKEATVGMLLAWRNVPELVADMWDPIRSIAHTAFLLVVALVAPLLFWLAPVLAIFTAYTEPTEEEIRARLRARIHKNGGTA
jgi:hypothetical protein